MKYGKFEFLSESGYPVPRMTFDIINRRTQSEQYIGSDQSINLEGKIYLRNMYTQYTNPTAFREDLTSSGLLLAAIDFKKKLLLDNIEPNHDVQIFTVTVDNSPIPLVSGSGYIEGINFDTSRTKAVNAIDYSINIVLMASLTGSGITADSGKVYNVMNIQDSIDIQPNWDTLYTTADILDFGAVFYPTYSITRRLSADGIRNTNSGALNEAVRWINDRQKAYPFTGIIDTGVFSLYNFSRKMDIDEINGAISIEDFFLAKTQEKDSPWLETCNISTKINENFHREITLNGEIQGLTVVTGALYLAAVTGMLPSSSSGQKLIFATNSGLDSITNMKYLSALTGYHTITGLMFDRVSKYNVLSQSLIPTGENNQFKINFPNYNKSSLNNIPISITETLDPINGKIGYSYTFNDRPTSLISGAISEILTINDGSPTPRHTEIPVIGRRLGPLVYFYTSSSGAGTRSVTYEGVFNSQTGFKQFKIDTTIIRSIDNLIQNYKPVAPYSGYETSNTESINLNENRVRKSISWTYTKCGN